ncbi:MAG: PIN domain-containing protein [Verrucomicrobia bacterium]|nr:PIN domain-containing protein [Verrucomicrobiota bacterium]
MKYLLDTNILSELMKAEPDVGVVRWVEEHDEDCGISAITLAELEACVSLLPPGKRQSQLRRELDFIVREFQDSTLGFTDTEAPEWGRYVAELTATGKPLRHFDSLIAATARQWHLTVVTRDLSDFPNVSTINPFAP